MARVRGTSVSGRVSWLLGASLAIVYLSTTLGHYRPLLASRDQYDDSYITYRYAANWAEGRGLVFNRDERVDAASSPLYAALLALLDRAGATDLEAVGLAIGLASGCWALFMVARCGLMLSGSALATAMFALPVALSGWLCGWSVSGMETTLDLALVITFVTFYAEGRTFAAATALALGLVCRPEGVLLVVAAGAAELWSARGRPKRSGWILIGTGTAVLLLMFAWRFATYGEVLPQPLLYKQVARYYAPGARVQLVGLAGFLVRAFALPALLGGLWLGTTALGLIRRSGGTPAHAEEARGSDASAGMRGPRTVSSSSFAP